MVQGYPDIFKNHAQKICAEMRIIMKIALINENSQAAKNAMVYENLKKVADAKGYEVVNYGMYLADDAAQLTYVQYFSSYSS